MDPSGLSDGVTTLADLPNEVLYESLHMLSYDNILNFCKTNMQHSSICDDPGFWQSKIRKEFPHLSYFLDMGMISDSSGESTRLSYATILQVEKDFKRLTHVHNNPIIAFRNAVYFLEKGKIDTKPGFILYLTGLGDSEYDFMTDAIFGMDDVELFIWYKDQFPTKFQDLDVGTSESIKRSIKNKAINIFDHVVTGFTINTENFDDLHYLASYYESSISYDILAIIHAVGLESLGKDAQPLIEFGSEFLIKMSHELFDDLFSREKRRDFVKFTKLIHTSQSEISDNTLEHIAIAVNTMEDLEFLDNGLGPRIFKMYLIVAKGLAKDTLDDEDYPALHKITTLMLKVWKRTR